MSAPARGEALPRAARPFVTFATLLRANGFSVAPEQTETFVAAVGLLGPRTMADIYAAARATLGPPPERREDFDALYRAHFLGQTLSGLMPGPEEDLAYEPEEGGDATFEPEELNEAGGEATAAEALSLRRFAPLGEGEALRRFRRAAPDALPRRRSRRFAGRRAGERPDMRRALREAVRRDGEILRLPQLRRRTRQRRILLLIDVSGSMKGQTEASLRLAHTLVHSAERAEVFTIGTRLTRVTRALRHRHASVALAAAAVAVADWDGGTRLGDALAAFLAVPRYAGFARSAYVVVLSDGLERGDPAVLIGAVERLARLAWGILWLTPLASGADFAPETEAMRAIAPHLDRIGSAASPARITHEILEFARTP
ncbi:VWA domain-containing protein [Acuticoccus kandeliae]|uniref:VWA domain-containing protein n=1 Tax=Acuticoccus kandeliae TaxID=2073160 RepID=UPI000D3EC464|nr:VWA domain-containing protein [Acuticoccus kandeliae]